MKVTYLNHSGFLLETKTAYFLFDYYNGTIPNMNRNKPIVVFVSHGHGDHYNREIYKLLQEYPDIQYVLAKDIPTKRLIAEQAVRGVELEGHILSIGKNVTWQMLLWNGMTLTITTLRSTDAGVAFLLEYDNHTYYHAGDLNLWYWKGESCQCNENMKRKFMMEMEKLKDRSIDAAFVPLDPRLDEHMTDGFLIFMEYTRSRWVFPMHMWGSYDIIPAFIKQYPEYKERVVPIQYEGQVFENDDVTENKSIK